MIAWFARNGVAANLCMLLIVVGGAVSMLFTKKELFPEFSLDTVVIRVPYLGAAPEEVEQGVVIRIEEALEGLDGVDDISSVAQENYGSVSVTMRRGYDIQKLKEDIKTRVDAISTFPEETERPIVEEIIIQRDIVQLSVFGDASERSLKKIAEKIRDEVIDLPGISQAEVTGVRDFEISIEVSEDSLQRYGLTFNDVVAAVRANSLDLPAGVLKTKAGEITLRTKEQAYVGEDFEKLPLINRLDGTSIRLGQVAHVVDGFVDASIINTFNGKPSVSVQVRQVGNEDPMKISKEVRAYVERIRETWLPDNVEVEPWVDYSFYLKGRLDLLIKNGAVGFLLVLISLALFLRPSLAFFVAIGIPVSFLGTFLMAGFLGVTINMLSLFAFILVLGIVVDDAIVVGESVFSEYQKGTPGVSAAIKGTHRVSVPVTFAVVTTMVAFLPIFFLPGQMGKFFVTIPLVVLPTLGFSLIQSKLVLPYHLSLCKVGDKQHRGELNPISRFQRKFSDGLENFINGPYRRFLEKCLRNRYTVGAAFIGIMLFAVALLASGLIRFNQFPNVPSDYIICNLRLPEGTPLEETQRSMQRIDDALTEIADEMMADGAFNPVKHRSLFVGFNTGGGGPSPVSTSFNSNLGAIIIELAKSELRDSDAFAIQDRWREKIGRLPGARSLTFQASAGGPVGLPVDILLTGDDFDELRAASEAVKECLREFEGLYDIRDSFSEGKREVRIALKEGAESMGLNSAMIGQQVRQAFYGAEAQRIQRDRDDIRVMVRYPESGRIHLEDIESMYIRTPAGKAVPIREVADLEFGEGYPTISRYNTKRVINIRADANKDAISIQDLNATLYGKKGFKKKIDEWKARRRGEELPKPMLDEILANYPGVVPVKGGEAENWEETAPVLMGGFVLVLMGIYVLLAIPFRSYIQPILVIGVVPFGIAGAVLGHLLLPDRTFSILSFLGIIALAGVVVNDSLVLVDFINYLRREKGESLHQAIREGGVGRFRPILLTSVTTFVGLVPILLERSLQAQFLIPMAASLAFGVLFATFITLLLVPCSYLMLEDVKWGARTLWRKYLSLFGVPFKEVPHGEDE